mmetsp:Transcript_29913/g.62504  ORF Transcript_29913/g.62504 Transcript_29913/m.62504 type:complete len:251 (-) Transcript_29913:8-760(-)
MGRTWRHPQLRLGVHPPRMARLDDEHERRTPRRRGGELHRRTRRIHHPVGESERCQRRSQRRTHGGVVQLASPPQSEHGPFSRIRHWESRGGIAPGRTLGILHAAGQSVQRGVDPSAREHRRFGRGEGWRASVQEREVGGSIEDGGGEEGVGGCVVGGEEGGGGGGGVECEEEEDGDGGEGGGDRCWWFVREAWRRRLLWMVMCLGFMRLQGVDHVGCTRCGMVCCVERGRGFGGMIPKEKVNIIKLIYH